MFLTILLFIILGFWLLGLLFRWLLPLILIRAQKRYASQFGGQFNYGTNRKSESQKKEGEVTVESTTSQDHKVNKNLGDYVDFEEEK